MNDIMMHNELLKIVLCMKKAGYNPIDQLKGYLETGDSTYITRIGGARDSIKHITKSEIRRYLDKNQG